MKSLEIWWMTMMKKVILPYVDFTDNLLTYLLIIIRY